MIGAAQFGRSEMSGDMNWERFAELAGAYGADLVRWPQAEQAPARRLAASAPDRAEALLAAERSLDQLLAFSPSAPPSEALRARVLALAETRPRWRLTWPRWIVAAPVMSGAALAAACAGLLCGVVMTQGAVVSARQDALASVVQSDPTPSAEAAPLSDPVPSRADAGRG